VVHVAGGDSSVVALSIGEEGRSEIENASSMAKANGEGCWKGGVSREGENDNGGNLSK